MEKYRSLHHCVTWGKFNFLPCVFNVILFLKITLDGSDVYVSMENITRNIVYGRGLTGILKGATQIAEGKVGNALMVAAGQYVDFGNNTNSCLGNIFLCTEGLTISMWVKLLILHQYATILWSDMSISVIISAYNDTIIDICVLINCESSMTYKCKLCSLEEIPSATDWNYFTFSANKQMTVTMMLKRDDFTVAKTYTINDAQLIEYPDTHSNLTIGDSIGISATYLIDDMRIWLRGRY